MSARYQKLLAAQVTIKVLRDSEERMLHEAHDQAKVISRLERKLRDLGPDPAHELMHLREKVALLESKLRKEEEG